MKSHPKATPAQTSGGIGFFGMLTILFIGLKITHVIDWSWLWVLSPLWLPITIFLVIGFIFLIGVVLFSNNR